MHTDSPLRSLSPDQYTLLMEQAKRESSRLRREAIAAFWRDVARAVASALRRLRAPTVPSRPHGKTAPCPR